MQSEVIDARHSDRSLEAAAAVRHADMVSRCPHLAKHPISYWSIHHIADKSMSTSVLYSTVCTLDTFYDCLIDCVRYQTYTIDVHQRFNEDFIA